jgi:hypothetical protein
MEMIMVAKRTDHNQAEIVHGLRAIGVTVQDLSQLGKGTPDLLCGWKGRNYLIEVKNCEDRAPRLTNCEEEWIRTWAGQVAVITSVEDAIAVIQNADYEEALAVLEDICTMED